MLPVSVAKSVISALSRQSLLVTFLADSVINARLNVLIIYRGGGATENARHENAAQGKM